MRRKRGRPPALNGIKWGGGRGGGPVGMNTERQVKTGTWETILKGKRTSPWSEKGRTKKWGERNAEKKQTLDAPTRTTDKTSNTPRAWE